MSYCINPWCAQRQNSESAKQCQECGTDLLIQGRYRLVRPLRELDEWEPSEIFEIDDGGQTKVMKVLKKASFQPQFEREARTLQHMEDAGIPRVEPDGDFTVQIGRRSLYCLVMEKIQGQNLDKWLQENGSIDQAQAIDWMQQLVKVLHKLHAQKLFHRDIKLSNIMLRPSGKLALIDFGTVRPMGNTYFAKISSGERDITSVVSPGYTPLEQINGKAVPQSDFYALGRSLIYLLTGKHPIDLPENEITGQLEWRSLSKSPVSNTFAQLLDNMTAPFLAERPLNAEVLLARLDWCKNENLSAKQWLFLIKQQLLLDKIVQRRFLIAANIILILLNLWAGRQLILDKSRPSNQEQQAEQSQSATDPISR